MRFYRTPQGVWFVPGTINPKAAERIEVPTDSQGLCHFLNSYREELAAPAQAEPPPRLDEAAAPAAPPISMDGFEDWILNHASQAEIERMIVMLGVRFGEAIRAARPNA